jgi:hypothetical protein
MRGTYVGRRSWGSMLKMSSTRWVQGPPLSQRRQQQAFRHRIDPTMGLGSCIPTLLPAEQLFMALPSEDYRNDPVERSLVARFLDEEVTKCAIDTFSGAEKELTGAMKREFSTQRRSDATFDALLVHYAAVSQAISRARNVLNVLSDNPLQPDEVALALADLCRFRTCWDAPIGSPSFAEVDTEEPFKIGGRTLDIAPGVTIARTTTLGDTNDFVLQFEVTTRSAIQEDAAPRILGQLLMCHSQNYLRGAPFDASTSKRAPRRVFAVRLVDSFASLYSLDATFAQVEAMCTKPQSEWGSAGRMTFRSSIPEPWSVRKCALGSNLFVQEERREFVTLLARLRHHLLSQV